VLLVKPNTAACARRRSGWDVRFRHQCPDGCSSWPAVMLFVGLGGCRGALHPTWNDRAAVELLPVCPPMQLSWFPVAKRVNSRCLRCRPVSTAATRTGCAGWGTTESKLVAKKNGNHKRRGKSNRKCMKSTVYTRATGPHTSTTDNTTDWASLGWQLELLALPLAVKGGIVDHGTTRRKHHDGKGHIRTSVKCATLSPMHSATAGRSMSETGQSGECLTPAAPPSSQKGLPWPATTVATVTTPGRQVAPRRTLPPHAPPLESRASERRGQWRKSDPRDATHARQMQSLDAPPDGNADGQQPL